MVAHTWTMASHSSRTLPFFACQGLSPWHSICSDREGSDIHLTTSEDDGTAILTPSSSPCRSLGRWPSQPRSGAPRRRSTSGAASRTGSSTSRLGSSFSTISRPSLSHPPKPPTAGRVATTRGGRRHADRAPRHGGRGRRSVPAFGRAAMFGRRRSHNALRMVTRQMSVPRRSYGTLPNRGGTPSIADPVRRRAVPASTTGPHSCCAFDMGQ